MWATHTCRPRLTIQVEKMSAMHSRLDPPERIVVPHLHVWLYPKIYLTHNSASSTACPSRHPTSNHATTSLKRGFRRDDVPAISASCCCCADDETDGNESDRAASRRYYLTLYRHIADAAGSAAPVYNMRARQGGATEAQAVSARTVAKYMNSRHSRGPSSGWRKFFERHESSPWACDFFCVQKIWFQTLYVFFVIRT